AQARTLVLRDSRLSMVPADCLLDLPPHPEPPQALAVFDPAAAADHVKCTFRMELRGCCQEERRHFVDICRDYPDALVRGPHPRRAKLTSAVAKCSRARRACRARTGGYRDPDTTLPLRVTLRYSSDRPPPGTNV